ncbi:hypothetical protein BaRGS_00014404, partial [Batillaria attramentaria]
MSADRIVTSGKYRSPLVRTCLPFCRPSQCSCWDGRLRPDGESGTGCLEREEDVLTLFLVLNMAYGADCIIQSMDEKLAARHAAKTPKITGVCDSCETRAKEISFQLGVACDHAATRVPPHPARKHPNNCVRSAVNCRRQPPTPPFDLQ